MRHRKPIKSSSTLKFFPVSMASLFFLALISLLFSSLSSAANHQHATPPHFANPSPGSIPPAIHQACQATRYPDICESSLANHVPQDISPTRIIQSVMSISSQNLKAAQSMVQAILDSSAGNVNRTTAASNCLEVLHNSDYRVQLTGDALPRGRIKDARAYMSAALVFQYDCWGALKYANDTQQVNSTMAFLDSLIGLTSNALSMIMSYDNFGNGTGSWRPPKTERDGFWESARGPGEGSNVGLPSGLKVDVTVCRGGGGGKKCNYEKVQEAVDAAPANLEGRQRFVIGIKEGVYEETVRVPLEKKNLVFLGDGMGKTVITGSLNVGQPGISTYNTATVGK